MTSFRPRTSALFALAALVATSAQTPAPSASPQPACARPNAPAVVLRAVEPDTPAIAQQQNIGGTVQVVVDLDERSEVTGARLQSSPSAILNAAALSAARRSTYRTQIRDCRPVPSEFVFSATFVPDPQFTTASGKPALTVSAIATVTVPPDYATVIFNVRGIAPTDAAATAAAQDAFADLRAKLIAAGIAASDIVDMGLLPAFPQRAIPTPAPVPPPGMTFPPTPPAPAVTAAPSFLRYRRLEVKVNTIRTLPAVVAVLHRTPEAVNGFITYGLRDRERAYRRAVAEASADVRARAEVAARAAGARLGALQQLIIDPDDPPFPLPYVGASALDLAGDGTSPPPVQVRAKVKATYAISG